MKTLVQLVQDLAKNVGLQVPDVVVTSSNRSMVEALSFANEVGEELSRRVDWSELYSTVTLTGDGTSAPHDLPAAFERVAQGIAVRAAGNTVRALTRMEWGALTATEGDPRYFLLENDAISFWPYLASGATATVGYISSAWCTGGSAFAADTDTVVFPDDLFSLGLIVRWRRQKGMDYADYEAEYEAALADFARFDDGARI